jgi:hypothetical protein
MNHAEFIIERLLSSGKITKEDLLLIEDPDLRNTVDIVHLSFCPFNHEHDCSYYYEQTKDDAWERGAHMYWSMVTRKILSELDLNCLGFRSCYYEASRIIKQESEEVKIILGLLLTRGNALWELIDQEPEPHVCPPSLFDGGHVEQLEQST